MSGPIDLGLPRLHINGARERKTCHTCAYFLVNTQDESGRQGFCRANPPQAVLVDQVINGEMVKVPASLRPPVMATDAACRLHKP